MSTDLLFAVFLVTSFLAVAWVGPFESKPLSEISNLKQLSRDTLISLDESGYIIFTFDRNDLNDSEKMDAISEKVRSVLPPNTEFHIDMTRYDLNGAQCIQNQTFDNCFQFRTVLPSKGQPIPIGSSLTREKLSFFRKGNVLACQVDPGQISLAPFSPAYPEVFGWDRLVFLARMAREPELKSPGFSSKTFAMHLAGASDANITLGVSTAPSGSVDCDQDIKVDLNVMVLTTGRKPVDIALVMDRSGSMSWDGHAASTDTYAVALDGNYLYLADGSAGIRDANIQNPRLPSLIMTLNTPGTAMDINKQGNYVFLADGASGFRIANASNPSNIFSVSTITNLGTANGIAVSGNYAFVAASASGAIYDVTTTTSSNSTLRLGYSAGESWVGQSFVSNHGVISGVELYLRRFGNPSNVTIHLRSSLTGADLASAEISSGSISTSSLNWETVSFSEPVQVTPDDTVFVVATTTTQSTSNYYQVGVRTSNPYAGGNAFQQSTALTSDLLLRSFILEGIQVVDVSDKSDPQLVETFPTTNANKVFVDGSRLFVADDTSGLRILDVSNPLDVFQLGIEDTTDATGVFVRGDYAFVADRGAGLRIINVSTPTAPFVESTFNSPGSAWDVWVENDRAYIADDSSLQVVDVSVPSAPSFFTSFPSISVYRGIVVRNNIAFISADNQGLVTIDLSLGPRINQAKAAGSAFLNFDLWKPQDQIGLSSFNTVATQNQELTAVFDDVNSALYALTANGGTDIQSGVDLGTVVLKDGFLTTNIRNSQLRFGYSSSESTAGQSFRQLQGDQISGVNVFLQKTGDPSGPVTVRLRNSISGSDWATATIPASEISSSGYNWHSVSFPSPVSLSSGVTYYIVLSTTGQSTGNYYAWGRNSANNYINGNAFQQSSSQSGDMMVEIRYVPSSQNPLALKFVVLMSDGQSNSGDSGAAALVARDNNVMIFTVAFGLDADQAELTNVADITGGKSYVAWDQNALIALYEIIAQEIGDIASAYTTNRVSDVNLTVPIPYGTTVKDLNTGVFIEGSDQNYIYYHIGDLNNTRKVWYGSYTFSFDCNSSYSCSDENRVVPQPGTFLDFLDKDENLQTGFPWDANVSITLRYRDLTLAVIGARPSTSGGALLDLNAINAGYLGSPESTIQIRRETISGSVVKTFSVSAFSCGEKQPLCTDFFELLLDRDSGIGGTLFAVINGDRAVRECPNNNAIRIDCQSQLNVFYDMDLWVWKKRVVS